jgi:hypothetical protein
MFQNSSLSTSPYQSLTISPQINSIPLTPILLQISLQTPSLYHSITYALLSKSLEYPYSTTLNLSPYCFNLTYPSLSSLSSFSSLSSLSSLFTHNTLTPLFCFKCYLIIHHPIFYYLIPSSANPHP